MKRRLAAWVQRTLYRRTGHWWYYSTGCLHGNHEFCRSDHGCDGHDKQPFTCKWCDHGCICRCHPQ